MAIAKKGPNRVVHKEKKVPPPRSLRVFIGTNPYK